MNKPSLKFGFIVDPVETFNPQSETTLFLMLEAQKRGAQILSFTLPNLSATKDSVFGRGEEIEILGIGQTPFYRTLRTIRVDLQELDALFLRKDPPVDRAYLDHLLLLEQVSHKIFMMNHPTGILTVAEKIAPLYFKDFIPETLLTRSYDEASDFASLQKEGIVLKPLHASGGEGVFAFRSIDSNFKVAFELLSQKGKETIVCQSFLPGVTKGDKRVLLLDGEPVGSFIRVPTKGEHRANLHRGGSYHPTSLTEQEEKVISQLSPFLKKKGLFFVGIDLIDEKLTEINVTSPMGIQEINHLYQLKVEEKIINFVEKKIKIQAN